MWFGFWHISAMQLREISLINIENTKYCGGTQNTIPTALNATISHKYKIRSEQGGIF